jgi:rod shape-determining protein MreD
MKLSIKNIVFVLFFLLLQIIWFNHILLFGKFSPSIFILPLLLLPIQKNETASILIAFIIGLFIDISLNTGGVFAATSLIVVYFRKIYFLFIKNQSQDIENIDPSKLSISIKFFYYLVFIFISQMLIYSLESFNISLIVNKMPIIIGNTLTTLFFFLFIDIVFINSKEE